jgi:Leucine-rich repeat (LRR) protein
MLKTISNKFSPEVIFTVILPGQALGNIDALTECVNLTVLTLNKNSIENLAPLKKLKKLRIVDLSENCLNNVDPLHNC